MKFQPDSGSSLSFSPADPIRSTKFNPDTCKKDQLYSMKGVDCETATETTTDLAKAGFKWNVLHTGNHKCEVVFYKYSNDKSLQKLLYGINLRCRSLGILSPNLSAQEWHDLLIAYGEDEKRAETFKNNMTSRQAKELEASMPDTFKKPNFDAINTALEMDDMDKAVDSLI